MFIRYSILFIFLSSFSVEAKIIGVSQFVSHESLDKVYDGVVAALSKQKDVVIKHENAHGNIAIAHQIAKKFVAKEVDVIIAIPTQSAISAKSATKDSLTPVVFASITDPVAAKLTKNHIDSDNNVVGVINKPPLKESILKMLEIDSKIRNVGVLYNPGEVNSRVQIGQLQEIAKENNINLILKAIPNFNDLITVTKNLVQNVDCLLLIQDNMVASGLSSITQIANEFNIMSVAAFEGAVSKGATIEVGINEFDIGYIAGEMALDIINGKKISDMQNIIPSSVRIKTNSAYYPKGS